MESMKDLLSLSDVIEVETNSNLGQTSRQIEIEKMTFMITEKKRTKDYFHCYK